jgi:hypothetical protein
VTPLITISLIEEDVLAIWRTLTLSLPKWNEKVFLATAVSDKLPVSRVAMEVHEDF